MPADTLMVPMLLTPREAAKALSLSERTLFTLRKSGELPAVMVGRAVRFDPADLAKWIQRKKEAAGANGGVTKDRDNGTIHRKSIESN